MKALIGREDSTGDDEMRDVVDLLCIRKEGEEGEPSLLELRPEGYELFDLEHPHLSHQQLQVRVCQSPCLSVTLSVLAVSCMSDTCQCDNACLVI